MKAPQIMIFLNLSSTVVYFSMIYQFVVDGNVMEYNISVYYRGNVTLHTCTLAADYFEVNYINIFLVYNPEHVKYFITWQ